MKKKVYIAGPITGDPDYREKFSNAADDIRWLGLEPVNPAEAPEGLTYKEYIDRGLKLLMECDMICMLPGSGDSPGASLESHYARLAGLSYLRRYEGNGYFITEKEEKND